MLKDSQDQRYCFVPKIPKKKYQDNISNERLELIRIISLKWVNGTVLHYYFFDGPIFGTNDSQKEVVRRAFDEWKKIGIGLQFQEVSSPADAEIRIGFKQGDGSWSYPGTYILEIGLNERTMNFGWSLTGSQFGFDTAIHEIGHTIGFPHEHQNPNAGIIWDEDEVYRRFSGPPNNWDDKKIYHNILKKIQPDSVAGSNWDPNSIMHYSFGSGLVLEPEKYKNGIQPEPGLSQKDIEIVKFFYPSLENVFPELKPLQSLVVFF